MFPIGHMGLTAALGEFLTRRRVISQQLDYRILLLGSMLPDVIDKPLGILLGIEGRNVAHSLLFSVSLTLFLILPLVVQNIYPSRIARRLTNPLPILTIGLWTHLLLDRIWQQPSIILWPFLGVGFEQATFDLFELIVGLLDPYVLGGEVLGLGVMLLLALRYRLYKRSKFLRLLRSGLLHG
ncbi:MAG: metal-dependent hydrolase [Candidatus Thermoplasmatota archaeon]|nr:metal-dependent hydrolase [Candidatus Thermoplasmatota archaeon]